ncbi:amidohydrolase family protein [Arcticibacter eurypsychrophilus]|uniref:amidohydrolase family protein n=1 Tax=Arcticibacter eurypsychrophilus TaxID=1434752 RepID=UPI00084CFAD6|nr:amidohydrolase family protein [Arcticibacter eurypsychrophilus]
MFKLDSHQHFWRFDPIRYGWITEEMNLIKGDFLPDDLKPLLDKHAIDGCIAVQSDQSEADNAFLIELATMNPFIKGVVGWVDLQADNIEETLQFYSQYSIVKGFRHVLQGEKDRALMLNPDFKRGIGLLNKFNYTYDLLIFQDQLIYASELCSTFPEQKFVLDHIAKPSIKNHVLGDWAKDIHILAKNPNVYCKVSGMVNEADWKNWKEDDFLPYLDLIFGAFGIKRLMFGSDWPVCNTAGGYDAVLKLVQNYTAKYTEEEQSLFWGLNASTFYAIV